MVVPPGEDFRGHSQPELGELPSPWCLPRGRGIRSYSGNSCAPWFGPVPRPRDADLRRAVPVIAYFSAMSKPSVLELHEQAAQALWFVHFRKADLRALGLTP
ncbi:hypothetical protein GCM10028793_63830 [Nocardiopsis oceani]